MPQFIRTSNDTGPSAHTHFELLGLKVHVLGSTTAKIAAGVAPWVIGAAMLAYVLPIDRPVNDWITGSSPTGCSAT
jgi:hypothetical protein